MKLRPVVTLACLPLIAGCDQLMDRLNIPNPVKIEAEGKAIGSACRHAGRGLEDCYRLNPQASKPAVFEGWREMNEYMLKNNMDAVPPQIPPALPAPPPAEQAAAPEADAESAEKSGTDATPEKQP